MCVFAALCLRHVHPIQAAETVIHPRERHTAHFPLRDPHRQCLKKLNISDKLTKARQNRGSFKLGSKYGMQLDRAPSRGSFNFSTQLIPDLVCRGALLDETVRVSGLSCFLCETSFRGGFHCSTVPYPAVGVAHAEHAVRRCLKQEVRSFVRQ